jgi:hypothetical protein
MNQLTFTTLNTTTRQRTCPTCKQPIRRAWPGDHCSIAVDIDPQPTTRIAALTALINGTPAVIARTTKRDRGAGQATSWIRLTTSTIGSSHLAGLPHHIAHRCGVTNPPPPDQTTSVDYPAQPPF